MFWQRVALLIVIVFALLFALGLIGWVGGWIETPAKGREVECLSVEDSNRLKELTNQSLDDAYQTQIEHLFEVWMRDLHDQPRRAQAGVANAIKAWRGGRELILQYQPPECPKK